MGVTGQVSEDAFGLFNRFPHTDDPLVGIESVFERLVSLAKTKFAATDSTCQMINELAAKDQGECFLVEQVILLTKDPSFSVF